MNHRERYLAVLSGRKPDRVPWATRLNVWYRARMVQNDMPDRFRGLSLREIERELGVGHAARGGKVFNIRREGVEVVNTEKDGEIFIEYITPVGTVSERKKRTKELEGTTATAINVEYPIKSAADYPVWEYITEHTYYDPCYEEFLDYDREVGEDGLPLIAGGDVPYHHFCLKLAGYNQAFFHLADYLPQVEHLLTVMEQCDRERLWPVLADSPAINFLHGKHFSWQMTPPPLFKKYIKPYYLELAPLLHARGKKLTFHGDNDCDLLLDLIKESGFDMGESFATAPLVNLTLSEARRVWGKDVIIWGGIPSVLLEETTSDDEFEAYLRDAFRTIAPGDAFMFGVSDNVMPGAKIERIERISQLVEELGRYPVGSQGGARSM